MTSPRAPDGAGARRGPREAIGRVARAGTIACLASVVATAGHAAHPILSEDPGTQGTGGVELEIGYAATRGDAGERGAELAAQLSIGVAPTLDVILRPTWLELRPAAEARRRGMGDSSLDLKWRFHDDDGVQLAVRGGIDLPTGDADRGLGADGVGSHGLVALGVAWAPATVLANVGTTRVRIPGERTTLPFASAALVGPAEAMLRTFIEVAAQANSDPQRSTWPAVARSGLVWKVGETVDLDVGIAGRLNRVAPSVTLLAGATLHW